MLEFFRKYQRYFFIVVTVVIIVTFSLFGSYKTMNQTEKRKDIIVGHAIDGYNLKYFEIKQLASLLGAEPAQNAVVKKDLIQTKIAEKLAIAYFDVLKPDLSSRLERLKRVRFYVHPAAPALNATEIWNQLSPGAIDALRELQALQDVNFDFFARYTDLYWMQEKCPPELIRRILFYHQNQYQLPNDPRILHEDFSLCSFHSLYEWLGANFYDLMAQFIINSSIEAEKKGFQVTKKEAEADLALRLTAKGTNCDLILRSIGIRKNDAIELWKKVLLFERYFDAVGESALMDHLSYQQFADFAQESAVFDLYQLPKELHLKTLDDLLQFEVYSKLALLPSDPLGLPSQYLKVEEVEKEAPELVSTSYLIQLSHVDLKAIEARLSMKEVWDWELDNNHWDEIKKAFPELLIGSEKNHFKVLEKLEFAQRSMIDDWTRQKIVASHPEWIEQELAKSEIKECTVFIFANNDVDGVSIQDGASFKKIIESFSHDSLSYRENDVIWRISQVQTTSEKSILSFADAKKRGRIQVDRFLERKYLSLRNENPPKYQNEKGDWLLFHEAKESVIRQVFQPLLLAIDTDLGMIDHSMPLDFYVPYRFSVVMQKALDSLLVNNELSKGDFLWKIEKSERVINRNSSEDWIMKEPFQLKAGQWSDVYVPSNGEIVFFYLNHVTKIPGPILEQIQSGKETLSSDVKGYLAEQIIHQALKTQAIVLPLKTEKEVDDNL